MKTVTSNSRRGYWSHPTIEHHLLHHYSNQSPSHLSLSNSCRSLLTGLSASAIALYPVILWSFKNTNQIMSVLWTNFPTTSHLTCIKTQGSYHGFQDPTLFCPHSSVTSFPTTVSWIHRPTAIFPPLCCSSNTVGMLLAHPSAWNTVFQISASSLPPSFRFLFKGHLIRKALLDQPVDNTSLSLPHTHPDPALFFIMTCIRHFLSLPTRIKTSWGQGLCTIFFYSIPSVEHKAWHTLEAQ